MPKITLVRSLKINIGRRKKMQAAPKMITYLYKVVCFFFSYKETFIPYFHTENGKYIETRDSGRQRLDCSNWLLRRHGFAVRGYASPQET